MADRHIVALEEAASLTPTGRWRVSVRPDRRAEAAHLLRADRDRRRSRERGLSSIVRFPHEGSSPPTCGCSTGRAATSGSSCSARTRCTWRAATPRTCWRSGASTASTRSCARRGRRASCCSAEAPVGCAGSREASPTRSVRDWRRSATVLGSSADRSVRTTTASRFAGRRTSGWWQRDSRPVRGRRRRGPPLRRHGAARGDLGATGRACIR